MNIIKPKSLKAGDTISIIAPSGNTDFEKILTGKKYFEDKGFRIKLGKNINNTKAYLSASDDERLSDLHEAFADKETNAILCARGGYGALRLVDKIDYDLIRSNPKIFCGYSDITVLNMMFYKNANLISFSGPMIQGDFANKPINEYTESHFFNTLSGNPIEISATPINNLSNTNIEGVLVGGNLSTFASLCGTDFLPDEKFILFIEDLNEPVYKIDRYMTQLLNIQKFKNNISAIAIGDFIGIEKEYINDFDNLLYEVGNNLNITVFKEFPVSHSKTKATIPYGAYASLDSDKFVIKDYLV